jgi:hypothetical protein
MITTWTMWIGQVYILGFTEDLERAKASLKDYKLGSLSF